MAARKRRGTSEQGWSEEVRERIRSSMLLNRLLGHALGECEMTQTQVRAAEICLRKTLPDLSSTTAKTEVTHRYVARLPNKEPDAQTWEAKQAQRLGLTIQ
jgi:hypothetical protein